MDATLVQILQHVYELSSHVSLLNARITELESELRRRDAIKGIAQDCAGQGTATVALETADGVAVGEA